jgi:pimeloyl-ACP methyl ester carboxylesterase
VAAVPGEALGAGLRHLIGHAIGAAAAVEAANRNPGRLDRLTLVAPFFLQPGTNFAARAKLPVLAGELVGLVNRVAVA